MTIWNPWHGCTKISPGCAHCYVYRRDAEFGKDSSVVTRTSSFDLPLKKDRQGNYKLQKEEEPVYTCMTSDFFVEDADLWRSEAWKMIRIRQDLDFVIITKRIARFAQCIPEDWGNGYPNVTILCTCEDQKRADERLPIFLDAPIRHKGIIHEPMLEEIHIEKYLQSGQIERVTCGGESGSQARACNYDWILDTRKQCLQSHVSFYFKQTGAVFQKDGKVYHIDRKDQMSQAMKAGISFENHEKKNGSEELSLQNLFERLARSRFRSSFHLKEKDKEYVRNKGMDVIRSHARDFVKNRLAPAYIPNDGKQTPMRGHPIFLAQHATGCCCRGCLYKWHHIKPGAELTKEQQEYVVEVLMEWVRREMDGLI